MCLAIPYKIVEIKGNSQAEVEMMGGRRRVSLEMFPEVTVGEWVLVNLGFVVGKISEDEAKEILRLYQEMAEAEASSLVRTGIEERRNHHE